MDFIMFWWLEKNYLKVAKNFLISKSESLQQNFLISKFLGWVKIHMFLKKYKEAPN